MPRKRELNPKFRINITAASHENNGLGRYMGNQPTNQPVGVIHGQEYAVSQPIVRALGGPQAVEAVLARELESQGAPGFQLGGAPVSGQAFVPGSITLRNNNKPKPPTADPNNWQVASTQTFNPMTSETPGQAGTAPGPGAITPAVDPVTVDPPASTGTDERTYDTAAGAGLGTPPAATSGPPPVTSASGVGQYGEGEQATTTPAPAPVSGLGEAPDVQLPEKTEEEKALERSIGLLSGIASRQDPTQRAIAENQLANLRAANTSEMDQARQNLAQAGVTGAEADARLAVLQQSHNAQEAQLAGQLASQAQERAQEAAVQLGQMEATQEQIDLAEAAQNLDEEQFKEYVRQFEVGSAQWEAAHNERIRQFEVGSDQWNKAYNEKIRQFNVGSDQWNKAFNEKIRQFEVGSDQWMQAFDEKVRQFEVGSDQWEREYQERMHQFDVGSDQWQQLFDQRERQFNAGLDQWNQQFEENRRQFNVGSEQWNKSFNQQIEQWKATMDQKDRQWLDSLTLKQQQQALQRKIAEHNMGMDERKVSMIEDTHANNQYWDAAKRFSTYAQTHLDAVDAEGNMTWEAKQAAFDYAKKKYPGFAPGMENTDQFEAENPDMYNRFLDWAKGEFGAAQDNRLTNPYDATIYAINSSSLPQETKDLMNSIFTDPNLMAQVAGVKVNEDGSLTLLSLSDAEGAAGEEDTFVVDRPKETGPAGADVLGGIEDDTIGDVVDRIEPRGGDIAELPGAGNPPGPPMDRPLPPTVPTAPRVGGLGGF